MWGGLFAPTDPYAGDQDYGGVPQGGGGGGDPFANSPYGPGYGFGETINVTGKDPANDPWNNWFFNRPTDTRPGEFPTFQRPGGGGLLPDNPSYMPPSGQTIPNGPGAPQGSIDITRNSRFKQWLKDEWEALKNFKFSMAGGGGLIEKLFSLFLKGYTGYELVKALKEDPDVPTGGTPGGGGKKGGGGGGGKGAYTGPSGVGVYQGLNYKPSFLAWQPTNAGSPIFSGGGPSSLRGTPPTPPPPPVKKPKKKKGA